MLKMRRLHRFPRELIDLIADYHDYRKYCLPRHKEIFNDVLNDIHSMSEIMPQYLSPIIAYECWGAGALIIPGSWDSFENTDNEDRHFRV